MTEHPYPPEIYKYLECLRDRKWPWEVGFDIGKVPGDYHSLERICLAKGLAESVYKTKLVEFTDEDGQECFYEEEDEEPTYQISAKGELALLNYQPYQQSPLVDDSKWLKQIEVATLIGKEPMEIQRLCDSGRLQTNGKSGKAKRISRNSVIDYCEAEGIAYNDT